MGIPRRTTKKIEEVMARLGIAEDDLDEHFIRSSQKGGQNVNKVSTCVYLCHRPTGVAVKCQDERSQEQNRLLARQRLAAKIATRLLTARRKEQARRHQERQRARRRSAASQEQVLQDKKYLARKKEARRQKSKPDYSRE